MQLSKNSFVNMTYGAAMCIFILTLGYRYWEFNYASHEQLQGQIEAQEYSVSSKVAGRIQDVYVKKGDAIEIGQPIFTINSPEVAAKMQQAQATQKAAGAMAQAAEEGARKQQVAAAKDKWKKASVATELAHKTYLRVNSLFKDGVVAEQKRDEAYTQWKAMQYTKQAAGELYAMAKEGTRKQTKEAARAKAQAAAGMVAEVQAYAEDLKIKSRYKGEVSQVLLQKGELAPQGFPVVSVLDMQDAWVVLHVPERQLGHFVKGTILEAKIPAISDTQIFKFKVTYLAPMAEYATWRATDVKKDFDMKTFALEAYPVSPIKNLRVGMSVLVNY